jgi:hypothetical protein
LEPIKPNFDWYSTISSPKNLTPRCPYANVDRCPRYYESLSLLGSAGITTVLQPYEEKRLLKKWRKSKLWPKVNEHATSVLDGKNFSHFCPEVSYDFFDLFASELHRYTDEIDTHAAHAQLAKNGVSANNWRWQWAHITPLHYSECRLYSQLLSEKDGWLSNFLWKLYEKTLKVILKRA